MNTKTVIALQEWWLGELKALTQKVMNQEDKRQERVRAKNDVLLADYTSAGQIQDAYGFGCITERQYNKLMRLWEEREAAEQPGELYRMKIALLQELYHTAKQVLSDAKTCDEREEAAKNE